MDGMRSRIKPSEPGEVTCLKCGKRFKSLDRIAIRICSKCKRDAERCGKLGDHMVVCTDVPIPPPTLTREDLF